MAKHLSRKAKARRPNRRQLQRNTGRMGGGSETELRVKFVAGERGRAGAGAEPAAPRFLASAFSSLNRNVDPALARPETWLKRKE
jgi:hypothetical protein